jgi:hypothetical protein
MSLLERFRRALERSHRGNTSLPGGDRPPADPAG